MTALAADRTDLASKVYSVLSIPVKGSTTIYKNAAVCVDANGLAVPASDTSGLQPVGYAREQAANAGADSAINVNVVPPSIDRYLTFKASSAVQAWVGDLLSYVDDQTVAAAGTTTNDICAGRCVEVISSTLVVVDTADRSAAPVAA